ARGVLFGASYTDQSATLPALRALTVLAVLCGALAVTRIWWERLTPFLLGLATLIGVAVIGQMVYPRLLHRFRVAPNELDLETPSVLENIRFTRAAYGLDRIEEIEFPADENLSLADFRKKELTLINIRLWAPGPALALF